MSLLVITGIEEIRPLCPGYTAAPRLKVVEHRALSALAGRTYSRGRLASRSHPVEDADPGSLHMFTLEGDGRVRTLANKGVRRRNRHYLEVWMTGQAGRKVRLRY
jgi:putative transposase